MSFLLMNLFSPATQATPLAGNGAVKADAGTTGNSGGGAAFSAMLASAKERLVSAPGAAKSATALTPQTLDATLTQAIKQPADALALLKDASLTEQQLNDLRAALRDMLDTESFAGDGETEQAFQELHDSIEVELADMGEGDVVDIEPVVMQLPIVTQAAQASRGDMLVRIAQFLQASLGGQTAAHVKAEQASQAQIPHQSTRTDPLLEVVQASMFHAQAIATAQTSEQVEQANYDTAAVDSVQKAQAQHGGIIMAAYVPQQHAAQAVETSADALPQWVRDIAPAAKTQPKTVDAGDIYQGMDLPEVTLPGNQAQAAAVETANTAAAVTQAAQSQPVAAKQVIANAAETEVTLEADAAASADAPLLPVAEKPATENQTAARDEAAPAKAAKPAAANAAVATNIHVAQAHAQPREALAPLPENTTQDVALEAVQTDNATTGMAPSHSDKLAATHAQRAVNASLYHHRAEVVEQVHVAIARASKAEMDRITIQLDPADLGRVDVTMEIRRDGTTQLFVTADRRETLDMLQRDARSLERALQESGVKADAGSMEFNLRQQNGQAAFGQGEQNFHGNGQHAEHSENGGDKTASSDGQTILQPEIISSATYTVNGGLNVVV